MNYLVSIIIPVYNGEKYINKCIESVLDINNKLIEILIINDGSTDNTLSLVKKKYKNYNNIKIINQKNAGVSSARNKGICLSSGKYLHFLDTDDYINRNTFKRSLEILENEGVSFLFYSFQRVNEKGSVLVTEYNIDSYYTQERCSIDLMKWKVKICMGSFFVKKDLLIKHNIFFQLDTKYGEDMEFIHFCLINSYSIKSCKEILNYYLYNEVSTMSKVTLDRFDVYYARMRYKTYVCKTKKEYTDLIKFINDYNIPEAVSKVLDFLCYEGINYFDLRKFLQKTNLSKIIEIYSNNDNINSEFKNILEKWRKNPLLYYITRRFSHYIYDIKILIYNTLKKIRKENN